MKHTNNTK